MHVILVGAAPDAIGTHETMKQDFVTGRRRRRERKKKQAVFEGERLLLATVAARYAVTPHAMFQTAPNGDTVVNMQS